MLKKLHIENFALVENLDIAFDSGFSVLTGETGAGKSIIVGAIARLLGEKADRDDIRSGAALAVIEGLFDISLTAPISGTLKELEIDTADQELLLRREIPLKGSSRSFINGRLVTLTQLRTITADLAELLGQHSHQQLLDDANHLSFLDHFAGLTDRVESLRDTFSRWENALRELARLIARQETEKSERELMLFQRDEITKAQIRIGEEDALLAEKKILDSSRTLGEKATSLLNLLELSDDSVLNLLRTARKELSSMAALDPHLENRLELLETSLVGLDELRNEIEIYRASIPDDPDRQEIINLRLDEIYRLKKKYGGTESSILDALSQIKTKLDSEPDIDDRIKTFEDMTARLESEYRREALDISAARKKGGTALSRRVEEQLKQLGFDSARFEFRFIYEDDPDGIALDGRPVKPLPCGLETGQFLISANPGEPLKPLARTASGGEISRIMLALKAADRPRTRGRASLVVLDEIDAGIGGQTAHAVAQKLTALSRQCQLLVITHLHQIAAVADHHLAVEKTAAGSSRRKVINIRKLNKSERKREIDRMLSLPENSRV